MTIRDITKVADTIDVLVGAGANEISGISFMVSKGGLEAARRGARRSDRGRAAQGGDLCARRQCLARPGAEHFQETAPGPIPYRKMAAGMAASTPVAQGEYAARLGDRGLRDQAGKRRRRSSQISNT